MTIGIDFLQRVQTDQGEHVMQVRLPDDADIVGRFGPPTEGYKTGSEGTPGRFGSRRILITTPGAAGSYEIAVRVLYSKSGQGLWDLADDPRSNTSDCVVIEDSVTLVVSRSTPAPGADLDIAGWLAARLRPAEWIGGAGFSGGYSFHLAKVAIGGTAGSFSASGAIEVLIDNKERRSMGRFSVSNQESSISQSWTGVHGSSSNGSSSGGRPTDAEVEFEIDGQCAFLGERVRYFIVFDEVTLPDGRVHSADEPIEIEMWPDALRAGPPEW